MSLPAISSLWKYTGPQDGWRGRVHVVAMTDPHEIVTIGLGSGGNPDHSWLGTPDDFRKVFVFAGHKK